jgi:hypothetical protein
VTTVLSVGSVFDSPTTCSLAYHVCPLYPVPYFRSFVLASHVPSVCPSRNDVPCSMFMIRHVLVPLRLTLVGLTICSTSSIPTFVSPQLASQVRGPVAVAHGSGT